MAFLILGLALLAMKMAAYGPVADWSWWIVLAPFGCAVAWWAFADSIGLTQQRAIQKMEKRKVERREKALAHLGLIDAAGRPVRPVQGRTRDPEPPPPPAAPKSRL